MKPDCINFMQSGFIRLNAINTGKCHLRYFYMPPIGHMDWIGFGSAFTSSLWIGLDWVIEMMGWIGLDLTNWTHVQLCGVRIDV